MLLDGLLMFDNATALAAGGGPSANVIDLSEYRDLGVSMVHLSVILTAALAGGTVQPQLQTSPDNTNWTTIESGPVAPIGASGTIWSTDLPVGNKEFLRINYVGTGITAGSVTSVLTKDGADTMSTPYYPRNYQA